MGFRGKKPQKYNNFERRKFKHSQLKSESNKNAKREFRHIEQLREDEVGVTEYINNSEGFTGVLKARFSDFHVNEVDLDGQVAVLNDLTIPQIKKVDIDYSSILETPLNILPQNVWDEIKKMAEDTFAENVVKFEVSKLSKDDRRQIHLKIKDIFGSKIMADTVDENDQKFLKFRKMPKDGEKRSSWCENWDEYVHFLVFKEGCDTMNACYQIADALNMKPSYFSYAGNKDKRAKTTQWFCVKRVEPWKLIKKTRKLKNIKIGNITFKSSPLKLGQLKGNKFKIVVKNVVCEDSIVNEAIEKTIQNGFINYYGLQRFGNDKEVPTYCIGLELLRGNWEESCKLILKPKKSDEPDSDLTNAKKIFTETKDPKKALECLRSQRKNCVEAKLLEGLSKENRNDFVNALSNIPRNTRLLYLHSFQSLIWNKMVSQRLKKFGYKPVVNDLVLINEISNETENDSDNDEENELTSENIKEKSHSQVKSLTESDLNNYTIFDIVLPLPGYDVEYPENMRDEYREELEKNGLSLEMPKQSVRTYTLSGDYRKIVCRVPDLKWKIMKYNDPNASLILSDFDLILGKDPPENIPDAKYKAVILEFSLNSSSYATMVLREIMKTDTSPSAQVKLNDYANPNDDKNETTVDDNSDTNLKNVDDTVEKSLLNDEQKMEEFKKSIFTECTKREHEEEDIIDDKKKMKIT